jgi:hypothetical protein
MGYECKTSPLILREHRIQHETRALRGIPGWKQDQTGGLKQLFNAVFHVLHEMIKSRRMRWAGHVACTKETRTLRVADTKARMKETNKRHQWENTIEMDLG